MPDSLKTTPHDSQANDENRETRGGQSSPMPQLSADEQENIRRFENRVRHAIQLGTVQKLASESPEKTAATKPDTKAED
jgi:hypothetical protein